MYIFATVMKKAGYLNEIAVQFLPVSEKGCKNQLGELGILKIQSEIKTFLYGRNYNSIKPQSSKRTQWETKRANWHDIRRESKTLTWPNDIFVGSCVHHVYMCVCVCVLWLWLCWPSWSDCVGDAAGISYKNCRQVHNEQYFFIGFFPAPRTPKATKKIYIFIKISSFGSRTICTCMHMCVFVCVCECVCHNHGLNKIEFDCDFGQNGKRARAGRVGAKL